MKTSLMGFLLILCLLSCKHSSKDPDIAMIASPTANDDITKNIVTDRFGDTMEIISNNTKNSVTIHLNDKTYELKKNETTPGYSSEDNKYLFTETKYEVTFLKRDLDMVLFHGKKTKPDPKMASK